jgi:hypothetical protein
MRGLSLRFGLFRIVAGDLVLLALLPCGLENVVCCGELLAEKISECWIYLRSTRGQFGEIDRLERQSNQNWATSKTLREALSVAMPGNRHDQCNSRWYSTHACLAVRIFHRVRFFPPEVKV